jgi:hypothetical protein
MNYLISSARKVIRDRLASFPNLQPMESYFVWKIFDSPHRRRKTILELLATAILAADFRGVSSYLLLHPFMGDHDRGILMHGRQERTNAARAFAKWLTLTTCSISPLFAVGASKKNYWIIGLAAPIGGFLWVRQHKAYKQLRRYNSMVTFAVSSVVERIVLIEEGNRRAEKIVESLAGSGRPFILMLRSYDLEVIDVRTHVSAVPPSTRAVAEVEEGFLSSRYMSLDVTAEDRLAASLHGRIPVIRTRDLGDAITDFREEDTGEGGIPRLCLPSNVWKSAIRELIELSPMIVVHLISLTKGVRFELETIVELGKQNSTMVVIADPPAHHSDAKSRALPGVVVYDYPSVDLSNELLQAFPKIIHEREIDYSNVDSSEPIRDWLSGRAPRLESGPGGPSPSSS